MPRFNYDAARDRLTELRQMQGCELSYEEKVELRDLYELFGALGDGDGVEVRGKKSKAKKRLKKQIKQAQKAITAGDDDATAGKVKGLEISNPGGVNPGNSVDNTGKLVPAATAGGEVKSKAFGAGADDDIRLRAGTLRRDQLRGEIKAGEYDFTYAERAKKYGTTCPGCDHLCGRVKDNHSCKKCELKHIDICGNPSAGTGPLIPAKGSK